jgi:arsenite methyltransferase
MAPPRFIFRQFSNPQGLLGRLVGAVMNRGNRRMNTFTVEVLALKPTDRVVDVGFGGGATLGPLAELVPEGKVIGVEPSTTMIEAARGKHRALVTAGRLQLEPGSVEELPLEAASVDAACSVNTIYFWRDPGRGAQEIRRVLKPGGRVAITFLPKDRMELAGHPKDIFRYWEVPEVRELLSAAGFDDVRVEHPPDPEVRWRSVVARRA